MSISDQLATPVTPIIEPAPSVPPVTPVASPALALNDQLTALIGEGKKYGTIQSALDSIVPAQAHITKLEAERTALELKPKEEATSPILTASDLESVLTKMQQPVAAPASVSADDVSSLLKTELASIEATKVEAAQKLQADTNEATFIAKMKEMYGDTAPAAYDKLAQEANTSTAELDALIRTNPTLVLKSLGNSVPAGTQPTQQSITGTPVPSASATEWSDAWVSNIRRTDKKRYNSADFQSDMLFKAV